MQPEKLEFLGGARAGTCLAGLATRLELAFLDLAELLLLLARGALLPTARTAATCGGRGLDAVLWSKGYAHDEGAALAERGRDRDIAEMLVDDLLDERKANAQTTVDALAGDIGAPEAREDLLHVLFGNADTRVAHGNLRIAVLARKLDGDHAVFRRVAHGIGKQVGDGLRDEVLVADDHHVGCDVGEEHDAGGLEQRLVRRRQAADHAAEVNGVAFDLGRSILETVEMQQCLDQATQATRLE